MTIKKNQITYSLLFLLILFNTYFQTIIPPLSYFDEVITAFSIMYICVNFKKSVKGHKLVIFFATLFLIVIGLAGNILFGYNANWLVVIKDIAAFIKTPMSIIAFSIFGEKHNTEIALQTSCFWSKVVILIMSVSYIISQFVDTGMLYDYRRGIRSFRFIYNHPTFLAYALVIMLACLVANGNKKRDFIFRLLGILLLILTMRDKAFAFVVVYLIIVLLIPNRQKIKLRYVLFAAGIAVYLSWDKILVYSRYSWSPRVGMYTVGLKLIADCFPFGSGFGTFASNLSGEYYSKLYAIYGFANMIGTNATNYIDLGDAGFPYYFGQLGIFGFVIFCYLLYRFYKMAVEKYAGINSKRQASILMLAYCAIALFVESIFVNEAGAIIPIVIFVFLGNGKNLFCVKNNYSTIQNNS